MPNHGPDLCTALVVHLGAVGNVTQGLCGLTLASARHGVEAEDVRKLGGLSVVATHCEIVGEPLRGCNTHTNIGGASGPP